MKNIISRSTGLIALFFLSTPVLAGGEPVIGSITFSGPTPVPTLSGIMLMMMALLLAVVGYRILKQKDNHASRMMVLSLIGVGALVSGAGGIKLINDAYASPHISHDVSAPGTYDVHAWGNTYNNTSSVILTVTGTDLPGPVCTGTCREDSTVAPAASCSLNCFFP